MGIAETWTDLGNLYVGDNNYGHGIYVGDGICLVSAGAHIYRSIDYGQNWTDLGVLISGSRHFTRMIGLGGGVCLAGTTGPDYAHPSQIWKSTDYGATWTLKYTSDEYKYADIVEFADAGSGTVFLIKDALYVYKSTDSGESWSKLTWESTERMWSLAYGSGVLIAGSGGSGVICRSEDGGVTWTEQPAFGSYWVSRVFYVEGSIFLCGTGNGVGKIRRSTDLGLTWTVVYDPSPASHTIYSFANFGNGVIVCGSYANAHIYRSENYGATWADLGQQAGLGGPPWEIVHCVYNIGFAVVAPAYILWTNYTASGEVIPTGQKFGHRVLELSGGVLTERIRIFENVPSAGEDRVVYFYDTSAAKIIFSVNLSDQIFRVHQPLLAYDEIRIKGSTPIYVGFKAAQSGLYTICVWQLPVVDGTANQVLKTDGSKVLGWTNLYHSLLEGTYHSDALTGSPVLGDIIFGNSTPKWARKAGNTTSAKKFLRQTGTGVISAEPEWDTIAVDDLPAHALDGEKHTVSGLTAGHFLKALTATTFGFAAHGLSLDDLNDVNAPTPSDGHLLSWDVATSKWINTAPGASSIALDDLTDVNAGAPADTEVLTWNAATSKWINAAGGGGGVGVLEVQVFGG